MLERRIGTAGWSLPAAVRSEFPKDGTMLQRYASTFSCAEINSTFYRPHRSSTFERWACSVPETFRFSLKVPRIVTHERRLVAAEDVLDDFLSRTSSLGRKRDVLLVQLPPSLAFERTTAERFYREFRKRYDGSIACEPRHSSWFAETADAVLAQFRVARVAADPMVAGGSAEPGGWHDLIYRRLHGSPIIYRSAYSAEDLASLARRIAEVAVPQWCIFDNTAAGAAASNALSLRERLRRES